MSDWRQLLVTRLLESVNEAGAWGYRAGSTGAAEPTALAALALTAMEHSSDASSPALAWLAGLQLDDGAVPATGELDRPHWPTALAILAWLRCQADASGAWDDSIRNALARLLEARGQAIPPDATIHDHDTSLVGWSWVSGTHSWIEPTGYAVLALRAAGKGEHPRVREGVELILDRALPEGGWNYGNRRVLEHVLRPFPATTGVALSALAGEPREDSIDIAISYLTGELQRVRTPLSLAWGLIGLRAWEELPAEAEQWLGECARRVLGEQVNPMYDALLLLAGADECPLILSEETSE